LAEAQEKSRVYLKLILSVALMGSGNDLDFAKPANFATEIHRGVVWELITFGYTKRHYKVNRPKDRRKSCKERERRYKRRTLLPGRYPNG
jgi:hypothetical protein